MIAPTAGASCSQTTLMTVEIGGTRYKKLTARLTGKRAMAYDQARYAIAAGLTPRNTMERMAVEDAVFKASRAAGANGISRSVPVQIQISHAVTGKAP